MSALHEQGRAVQEKMDAWGQELFEVNMPARIFQAVQSLVTLTRMQSEEIERLKAAQEASPSDVGVNELERRTEAVRMRMRDYSLESDEAEDRRRCFLTVDALVELVVLQGREIERLNRRMEALECVREAPSIFKVSHD